MHWFLDQCAQVLVNCDETGWMFVALRSSALETSSVAFLGGLTESGPHWTELAGAHDARRPFRGAPGVMDTRRQSTPGGSKRQPPRWMDDIFKHADFIQLLRPHGGPYFWTDG